MKTSPQHYLLFSLILFLSLTACVVSRNPVTGRRHAYGFNWKKGQKMGAQAAEQTKAQYGLIQNKQLQNYVQGVAHNVLEHSSLRGQKAPKEIRDSKIHYHVIDNSVVNAFTFPGGYIYVDRGLLSHLQNEAQLAMVIGHETGHAAARHSAQQAFSQQLGQIALLGGAIVGQKFAGIPAQNILQLGGLAEQYLFAKYSRDDEREADKLGVEYAAKAGYQAKDGAGFFGALQQEAENSGAASVPAWQQTHPDPGERIKSIEKQAEKWKQKGYSQKNVHQDKYMHAIANMIYGDNPRHGFTKNGMFYEPELKFKFPYPKGWQVANYASAVEIVNSDQNAIIEFQIDSKNKTPRASVEEFLDQDGVNGGNGSSVSSNGLNAYKATATGQTDQGDKVKFYLYSLKFNGKVYRFINYSTDQQFSKYRSDFERVARGFDKVTDKSILNIKPARLHVFQAQKTAPFKSFLPKKLPLDIKAKDVATANQVKLDDTIKKGDWLKIPRQ
jgi:predicted Zn-dependent protease